MRRIRQFGKWMISPFDGEDHPPDALLKRLGAILVVLLPLVAAVLWFGGIEDGNSGNDTTTLAAPTTSQNPTTTTATTTSVNPDPALTTASDPTATTATTTTSTTTTEPATSVAALPGRPLPRDAWALVGDTVQVGGTNDDGSFTLQAGEVYWSGVRMAIDECDYRFSGEGMAVDGTGFGLVARVTFSVDERPIKGQGIQYTPEINGVQDTPYTDYLPDLENGVRQELSTDIDHWHTLSIEVQGDLYSSYVDGVQMFSGRTDATCGDLYVRVWRGSARFRNLRVEALDA